MINDFKKNILLASLLSFLVHFSIVQVLSDKKKELEVKKYSVVNLASFKEYVIPEVKQQVPKNNQKPDKKESVTKIEKLKVEKLKINKPKINKPKIIEKNKIIEDIFKKKVEQKIKEDEKIFDNDKKTTNVLKEPRKEFKTKRNVVPKDTEILNDKDLTKYFNDIVQEMTILAKKSYPRQSRMFKEQGKIIIAISINSSGEILNIRLITKKPRRLANAARNLLTNKKRFSKPPQKLFKSNSTFDFEIPINFILN